MLLTGRLLLLAVSVLTLNGQRLSFEVASLKPVQLTPGNYNANLGTARRGEIILTNATLSDCLRFAYTITNDAQIAGPDWIRDKSVRFDIQAKAAPDTPTPQLLQMLQTLLGERFKLELHRESKTLPHLALVPAKNGHKLRAAVEGSDNSGNRSWPSSIISNRMAMPLLATLLSRFTKQTVLDMTGLTGVYEIKLEWTPEPPTAAPPEGNDPSGPSIYSAIQEQVGLKLEARKGPVEVLVVDRAERVPLGN